MRLVARLLGRETKNDDERGISQLQATTRERTRRELISMAVRDTLKKHGLAAGCVTADALPSFTSAKHRGMHIQLVFRDWHPTLLSYVVALEAAVKERLHRLDPLSPAWITGLSWRFEPQDRSRWPQLPKLTPASASSASARGAPPVPGTAVMQELLQSGDEAFRRAGRQLDAASPEFSPTLPMPR